MLRKTKEIRNMKGYCLSTEERDENPSEREHQAQGSQSKLQHEGASTRATFKACVSLCSPDVGIT